MSEALGATETGTGARRRRNPLTIVLSVLIGLGVLVAVFFIADGIARGVAERRVAEEIVAQLPHGVVASPSVHIGGTSVIAQYLGGRFEDVTVSAPDAVVDGIPADVTLQANGFPVDTTQPVDTLTGTVTLSEDALNTLVERTAPNSAVQLGSGELSYAAEASFFGFTVGYRVTGELQAAGDSVLVTPTGAEVTAGGGSLDVGRLVDLIVGSEPISVCTAQYLPVGIQVSGIDVVPGSATVRLEAHDLVLNDDTLGTLGSCAP
ncbi:LmeA family phospholipid-binding protein [Microterricola viridarii]|uniref:DUF2993 domain-containing protein n=1 Tax=Microterricola viridarii TaxID=412690 RepID=A0A1H1RHA3_9MICO|nr:DUF2993 domain-containing protein [Microterricola viridarii]SDS35033.1 Protein of unknown function [Microterricola viridarii]